MSDQDGKAYERDGRLIVPWKIGGSPSPLSDIPLGWFGKTIHLLTPDELAALPDGTLLVSIFGNEVTKGRDRIDGDTRAGRLAYGLPVPA